MTCAKYGIRIVPRWLGHRHLQEEDDRSKLVDKADYSLAVLALEVLDELSGGRHTHDRFATCENRRAGMKFNSQFFSPGTSSVEAFTQDWGGMRITGCILHGVLLPRQSGTCGGARKWT